AVPRDDLAGRGPGDDRLARVEDDARELARLLLGHSLELAGALGERLELLPLDRIEDHAPEGRRGDLALGEVVLCARVDASERRGHVVEVSDDDDRDRELEAADP